MPTVQNTSLRTTHTVRSSPPTHHTHPWLNLVQNEPPVCPGNVTSAAYTQSEPRFGPTGCHTDPDLSASTTFLAQSPKPKTPLSRCLKLHSPPPNPIVGALRVHEANIFEPAVDGAHGGLLRVEMSTAIYFSRCPLDTNRPWSGRKTKVQKNCPAHSTNRESRDVGKGDVTRFEFSGRRRGRRV